MKRRIDAKVLKRTQKKSKQKLLGEGNPKEKKNNKFHFEESHLVLYFPNSPSLTPPSIPLGCGFFFFLKKTKKQNQTGRQFWELIENEKSV